MGTWIDATIWTDEGFNEEEFIAGIEQYFERFAFGREYAPSTGRRHLQFRGILSAKTASTEEDGVILLLSKMGFRHITRTGVRNFDYVYKSGDYYLSWEKIRKEYRTAELCPWQLSVCRPIEDREGRYVEIYVDLRGNAGKTFLAKWLESKHQACYIPPLGRASDILSAVLEKPKSGMYIIDMPRAMPFTREFWCAVEMVKNGVIYDHRYKYKEVDLGYNPRVVVFANEVPIKLSTYLSKDRIKIYQIDVGSDGFWGREHMAVTERPDWKNWEEP